MSQPTKPKGRVLGAPKTALSTPVTPTKPSITEPEPLLKIPTPVHPNGSAQNSSLIANGGEYASAVDIGTPDIISSDATVIESSTISATPSPMSVRRDSDNKESVKEEANLTCPICNEKMVSLLQLNRHLDDEHLLSGKSNSAPNSTTSTPIKSNSSSPGSFLKIQSPNEEIRSWLKKTNDVKSKLQTAIPRKFVKLDIFDNNNNFGIIDSSSRESSSNSLNTMTQEVQVTRKHWKKPHGHDPCSYEGCHKVLSIKNGIVNCRKCGKLYCNEHTNYRLKLDAEAHYDQSGIWSRCCESCFVSKPGYNDLGLYKDLTEQFKNRRQDKVNERQFYENKLEKRLINLATRFTKIDREFKSNEFNSNFLNFKINARKREVEQQLVQWEDEKAILNCFICLKHYSFTLRKHHCRLCGKVVCGSDETGCSKEIPVNVLTGLLEDLPKINDNSLIRLCRNCKDVLFLKRNFTVDIKKELSPLLSKFETQQNVKKTILFLMPKFRDLILKLQSDKNLKSKAIIAEASKLRRRLVDSFGLFDKLTKEIIALECSLDDEKRLQLSIQTESAIFIQQNMAPLKQLPRILKQIEDETKKLEPPKLSFSEVQQIKSNRETLMVLNEQKFLVDQMIESCKKQRKYDEIPPLAENLKEITRQIEGLQLELGNDGF